MSRWRDCQLPMVDTAQGLWEYSSMPALLPQAATLSFRISHGRLPSRAQCLSGACLIFAHAEACAFTK